MVILAALILLLFLNTRGLPRFWRYGLIVPLVGYYLLWLVMLQIDLSYFSPDGTYGCDARYYWQAMCAVVRGSAAPSEYAGRLYVWWGAFILRTAPTESVIWIKLGNVLLMANVLTMLAKMVTKRLTAAGQPFEVLHTSMVLLVAGFANGIVVWMVIRNLKETLLLFVLMSYVYAVDSILARRSRRNAAAVLSILAITLLAYFCLNNLRTIGGWMALAYLPARLLFGSPSYNLYRKRKAVSAVAILMAVGLAVAFFSIQRNVRMLNAQRILYHGALAERFLEDPLLTSQPALYPVRFARFLLGPGPLRSLRQILQHDVFEVSTAIGDILILLGSVQWWVTLGFWGIALARYPKRTWKKTARFADLVVLAAMLIAAYSYVYGGTGDTRHRALVYIVLSAPIMFALAQSLRLSRGEKAGTA